MNIPNDCGGFSVKPKLRDTPFGVYHIIIDVRIYDKGYVRLTTLRRDAMPFSPTLRIGLNNLAPYLLMVNCHAGYMIWRVTRITITRRGYKPELFQPHPSKGWGIDIRTLFGGLKA